MSFELFIALLALITLIGAAYYIKFYRQAEEQAVRLAASALETAREVQRQQLMQQNARAQAGEVVVQHAGPTLAEALRASLHDLRGCYAVAYVDIGRRTLLGIEKRQELPHDMVRLAAAAASDLYAAPGMAEMAAILHRQKHLPPSSSNVNEIIVRGDGAIYILLRALSNIDRVAIFVCEEGDSGVFGLIWVKARQLMPQIELAAEAAFLVD